MAFFDDLKKKANELKDEAVGTVNRVAAGAGGSKAVSFDSIPTTLEELKALPQASLQDPADTAALTVLALCLYPADKDTAVSMLNFLKGPQALTPMELQFLADRFSDKDYVPRSYFEGARPENDYEPSVPYTLTVKETPYSRSEEGYVTEYLTSGGADNPRPVKLRKKASTGQWFLWEQQLLGGIRIPAGQDPWA